VLTDLEVWHLIYDAAISVGLEPSDAVERADERYWPDVIPTGYEMVIAKCSPFPLKVKIYA
jgi:hypothetical protein